MLTTKPREGGMSPLMYHPCTCVCASLKREGGVLQGRLVVAERGKGGKGGSVTRSARTTASKKGGGYSSKQRMRRTLRTAGGGVGGIFVFNNTMKNQGRLWLEARGGCKPSDESEGAAPQSPAAGRSCPTLLVWLSHTPQAPSTRRRHRCV